MEGRLSGEAFVRSQLHNAPMAPSARSRGPAATSATQLRARLDREGLPAVAVVAGAEPWFRAAALAQLVDAALPEGDAGGALVRLDARSTDEGERVASVLDELRTPSLFSAGKVVVIANAEAATETGDRSQAAAITRIAKSGVAAAQPGALLVLVTPLPVKGRGSVQAKGLIDAGAWLIDCRALYDAPAPWERGRAPHDHELARFLVGRAQRAHGKRLSLPDAHALCRLVGSDLAALDDALKSLALYVGGREEITGKDLAETLGETREDPVWRLVDAVLDGEPVAAMGLVDAAFDRGLSDARGVAVVRPEALAAMITAALHGAYRRVLSGAEGLARGASPEEVAKAAGVPPFLSGPFLARCRRDPEALLALNRAFVAAETGTKGGGVPPRLATERLVGELVRGFAAASPAAV